MIFSRKELSRKALTKALQLRKSADIDLPKTFCIYDLVDAQGLDVRFNNIPSMEGLYSKGPRSTIIISSLRPAGRQVFTCAHELGHHVFGHSADIIDCVVNAQLGSTGSAFDPDEFLADSFASYLLMPSTAVKHAFAVRGWQPAKCTPLQVYTIAGWLGVGYTTLITQLQIGLNLISAEHANQLRKIALPKIRSSLLSEAEETNGDVLVVDEFWLDDRPVDIQVGDLLRLPPGIVTEGKCVTLIQQTAAYSLVTGVTPGIGQLTNPQNGWATFVRVRRRNYVGLGKFRHFEEVDDEE